MRDLKVLRVERDLTQYELSSRTSIPQSKLSLIENGLRQPSEEDLGKLASALGVTKRKLGALLRRQARDSAIHPAMPEERTITESSSGGTP
jgi:transcriptional regulator with XRE-family HTH domain